jgi:hypothetical protein
VTLLVRRDSLVETMSSYLIDEIEAAGNIEVRPNAELTACSGDGVLETITLRDRASGHTEPVPAAAVFIQISAEPYTAWLPPEIRRDAWGYLLTGRDLPAGSWPLERPPLMLETSVPGVLRRATPARARRSESPPPLAKDRSSSNRSTSCSTPGTPRAPRPAGTLREPRSVLGEIRPAANHRALRQHTLLAASDDVCLQRRVVA